MRRSTHFRMTEEKLVEGEPYTVECGAELRHARFEFCWDADFNIMDGATRTMGMCGKCWDVVLGSVKGRRYIYGLSEGESAKQEEHEA